MNNNAFYFVGPSRGTITWILTKTNTIVLTWLDTGWRLFGSTNALSTGLRTNATWSEVFSPSGYSYVLSNQAVIPIIKTNPTAFYRLINP